MIKKEGVITAICYNGGILKGFFIGLVWHLTFIYIKTIELNLGKVILLLVFLSIGSFLAYKLGGFVEDFVRKLMFKIDDLLFPEDND